MMLLVCIMSSFASGHHHSHNKGIPNDFDARHCILLIEDSPNDKRSDKIELLMKELYPYKYEIVNKDIRAIKRDPKYADKELYRYVLCNDEHLVSGQSANYSFEVYAINDRKIDKQYRTIRAKNGFSAGSFKHCIKKLVKYMAKQK